MVLDEQRKYQIFIQIVINKKQIILKFPFITRLLIFLFFQKAFNDVKAQEYGLVSSICKIFTYSYNLILND